MLSSKHRFLCSTLCILLFGSPVIAEEKVYRWIDGNGSIQFSQHPPPNGGKATEINIKVSDRERKNQSGQNLAPKNQLDIKTKQKYTNKSQKSVSTKDTKLSAEICAAAQKRMKILETSNPRTRFLQPDGTYRQYSVDERDAMLLEGKSEINKHCIK